MTSTLDILIHSDISRICGYGKTDPEDVSLMERDDVIRFLTGHRIYFAYNQEAGDGRQLLDRAKKAVLKILQDGPLSWTEVHTALLRMLGTDEELTPGVELYFQMANEGLIESGTVEDGDPILSWATMVRLAEVTV